MEKEIVKGLCMVDSPNQVDPATPPVTPESPQVSPSTPVTPASPQVSPSTPVTPVTPVTPQVSPPAVQATQTPITIVEPGITIVTDASGIQLRTYDPANPIIIEDFTKKVTVVQDSSGDLLIVDQIKLCAAEIQCSDFHGKGSIEDYTLLFDAASKIVSDVKHVQLDVDIQGFQDFGQAADELSALFEGFTKKIQSVNMIDDTVFLEAILSALQKIVRLSNTFGKFKETIVGTTTVELSTSVGETKRALEAVSDEVQCAMKYIQHFVNPTTDLEKAKLNDIDKNVIQRATTTIEAWSQIYENGVSVAMNQNEDIQYIHMANGVFKDQAIVLRQSTSQLRNKYSRYF